MFGLTACAALLFGAGCAPTELGAQGYSRSRASGGAPGGPSIRLLDGGAAMLPPADAGAGKVPDSPNGADASIPDAAPPPPTVTAYPAGPYGGDRGETLADHSFQRPMSGEVRWSELRGDTHTKVFVWVISASWCGACQQQVPHLNELHQRLAAQGVVVVESLFQDPSGAPAGPSDAADWVRSLDAEFQVVADHDPAIMPSVTPTARLIDAETMRVIQVFEGDDGAMDSLLETALRASTR